MDTQKLPQSSGQKLDFLEELDLVLTNKPKLKLISEENGTLNCKTETDHEPNKSYVVMNSCGSTTDLIAMWQKKVRNNTLLETMPKTKIKLRKKQRQTLRGFSRVFRQQFQHKTLYHLEGIEKQEVLQILFHLFDRKQQGYLNQYQWTEFLKVRLIGSGSERDENWAEFVEVVESVTYSVCGDENVNFEKFCEIFLQNDVLTKFFRLIDTDASGVITAEKFMEFISHLMSSPWSNTRLNKESVQSLERLFRKVVPNGDFISKEDFKLIIPTKNDFFLNRVFDIFNESGSGFISLAEFLAAMHQFASGQDPDAKIRFLFKVYDADNDGKIGVHELSTVIKACMDENGMKFSDAQTDELTQALFDDADVEGTGSLTFPVLKAQLEKHQGLLENMSIMLDQWLVPHGKSNGNANLQRPNKLSTNYLKNNYVYLIWYHLFLVVNISLFSSRFFLYQKENPGATKYLILAKSSGQCLNFNCTFIVVLMLRQCLTFLRARGASAFLPIDQHIKFHKLTGIFTFFFGLLHTVMHLINIAQGILPATGINSGNWTYLEFLFDPKTSSQEGIFSAGLIPGYAFNTGVLLMTILTIMMVGSLPCVRKGGCFQIFYWTHLLYYPFWALLIIHAPNFWKWFIIPGLIFVVEQMLRCYNSKVGRGHTWVSSGILLPSKVTHVVIRRPPNFDFCPGDYVFVRIPNIAKYEWHPFTISSAPEQRDEIWLHVRACGEWTTRLHEYFEKEQIKGNFGLENIQIASHKIENLVSSPAPTVDEVDLKISAENLPIVKTPKLKLKASQSLSPNLETRYETFTASRSISVYEKGCNDKEIENFRVRRTTAKSFKYARNKPKVIALQVPLSNETESVAKDENNVEMGLQAEKTELDTETIGKPLEIFLDGPHGAPSSHIFRAEHAVLIATGIGVTPFASILQSIMHRYLASRVSCPSCNFKWCEELTQSTIMNLRKVDFFWINRDQKCFEWFVQLLSQLEIEQAESGVMERFLDMHMYITSALQKTDMKAVGLQLALDLLHKKEKRDLITGLKTRTNAGRPNWNRIFQKISDQKKGKITVFYCGPPALARILKFKCNEFGFTFRKEIF